MVDDWIWEGEGDIGDQNALVLDTQVISDRLCYAAMLRIGKTDSMICGWLGGWVG